MCQCACGLCMCLRIEYPVAPYLPLNVASSSVISAVAAVGRGICCSALHHVAVRCSVKQLAL